MELLQSGKIWIEDHPTQGWAPGQVDSIDENGHYLVVDEEGGKFHIPQEKAVPVDPACLKGADDLLSLGDFNEAALLHNIRVRYMEDNIYTGIGSPILISVNPYKSLAGCYTQQRMKQYRDAGGQEGLLPPHLFSVAHSSYLQMLNDGVNQSIIISGESGAGKTEATKRILEYLANVQQQKAPSGTGQLSIERQVLRSNPILEGFGNAKTIRNDNSSRFGKFIEIVFGKDGRLLSAQISNYLLEKCRIVGQQPDERNYHAFYQLCAGAEKTGIAQRLRLRPASEHNYTAVCDFIRNVDDEADFVEMSDCMVTLGFSLEERESVFKIAAAVLHLGDVEFKGLSHDGGGDGSEVCDKDHARLIADLLGVDSEQLLHVFGFKTLEDPMSKKIIHMPQDPVSAAFARDSIAKLLYGRLFDWLVWRINQSMSREGGSQKNLPRMGLLDIYGFEIFDWNSFEQLCINFANERLQQHFNSHMFTLEQKLYTAEGITWSHITWKDNQDIIDAMEKKPLGLFCLLDSECLMPNSTDTSFYNKILNSFKGSKIVFKPGRFQSTEFAVAHYAGEVVYNTETFLEKNTDKLRTDFAELVKTSSMELAKTLFVDPRFAPEVAQTQDAGRGGRGGASASMRRQSAGGDTGNRQKQHVTVAMMFRQQLDRLVEDLNKTHPRYVRCIKPNGNKSPQECDSRDVLRQLRCAGMLEAIRIRRAGYSIRREFKDFFQRFHMLCRHLVATGRDSEAYKMLCQKLLTSVDEKLRAQGIDLGDKPWQLGRSKVFVREDLGRELEKLMGQAVSIYVLTVQRCWRGLRQRRVYIALRKAAVQVQVSMKTRAAVRWYQIEKERRQAAIYLQSVLRAKVKRDIFKKSQKAVSIAQRLTRGWLCRRRMGNLKGQKAAERLKRLREEEEQKVKLEMEREAALQAKLAADKEREELARQKEELEQLRNSTRASNNWEHDKENCNLQEVEHQKELQQATSKLQELKEENDELKIEKERLLQEVVSRGSNDLEADLQAEKTQCNYLRNEVVTLREDVQSLTLKNEQLRAEHETTLAKAEQADLLMLQVSTLTNEKDELLVKLGRAEADLKEALRRVEADRENLQQLVKEKADIQKQLCDVKGIHSQVVDEENSAIAQLRSDLLSRIGQPEVKDGIRASFEQMDMRPPSSTNLEGGRKSIVNQREMFEKIKREFAENKQTADVDDVLLQTQFTDMGGDAQRARKLEDELRQLRRENAELRTQKLMLDEEGLMSSQEIDRLRTRNTALESTLQDLTFQADEEKGRLRLELENSVTTFRRQTQDMERLQQSVLNLDGEKRFLQNQLDRTQEHFQSVEAQKTRLEAQIEDTTAHNDDLQRKWHDAQAKLQMTSEHLRAHQQQFEANKAKLEAAEKQLAESKTFVERISSEKESVQGLLQDVMEQRHGEAQMNLTQETSKWKQRADCYEQEYRKIKQQYDHLSVTVGKMNQAACDRADGLSETQAQSRAVEKALANKDQEIRALRIEKDDLARDLESSQTSCKYFQDRYKAEKQHRTLEQQQATSNGKVSTQVNDQLQYSQREAANLRAQNHAFQKELDESKRQLHSLPHQVEQLQYDVQRKRAEIHQSSVLNEALNSLVSAVVEQLKLYEGSSQPPPEVAQKIRMQKGRQNQIERQVKEVLGERDGVGSANEAQRGRASLLTEISLQRLQ